MLKPITDICIVSKHCPQSYTMVERTTNGDEADLWKDKMFRSKVKRYLCYSKENKPNQDNVVTDIALVGLKDPPPNRFVGIHSTADTSEDALHKQLLCYSYAPRSTATMAITDVMLCKDDLYQKNMYTLAGETNGIKIAYKISPLTPSPRLVPRRSAPGPPTSVSQQNLKSGNTFGSSPRQTERPKSSTAVAIRNNPSSCLQGIPFKLNERLKAVGTRESDQFDISSIVCMSPAELLERTKYDFATEKKLLFP